MRKKPHTTEKQGPRHGEKHQRAKICDHDVETMRRLHEDEGWGLKRLSKWSGLSRRQVGRIVHYTQR